MAKAVTFNNYDDVVKWIEQNRKLLKNDTPAKVVNEFLAYRTAGSDVNQYEMADIILGGLDLLISEFNEEIDDHYKDNPQDLIEELQKYFK